MSVKTFVNDDLVFQDSSTPSSVVWNSDGGGYIGLKDDSSLGRPISAYLKESLVLEEIATPANPPASNWKLYIKSDEKLYKLDSSGTESEVGGTTSPGGLDSYVQYNDGGSFGGDANLTWDKINDRLGIGTAAPDQPLHVYSATGAVNIHAETAAGNVTVFKGTAVPSSGDATITSLQGSWDGTLVGAINVMSGDDTTNKDDGWIQFQVAEGGVVSEAMRIEQDGNITVEKNLDVKGQAGSPLNTLSDAATVATNCDNGNTHTVTLSGNRTLGNPTNMKAGYTYIWIIKQDGTGNRTLAYDTAFKFPGGTAPTLSTAGGSVDILTGVAESSSVIHGAMQNDSK